MSTNSVLTPPATLDYSLTGVNSTLAVEKGLAEAEWYQSPVPRETMRALLQRRDGPAIRDTILWFALILGTGFLTYALWGSWWAILPYMVYSVLYASTSDSRWHESGHGTAFKTDWMNNALYEIASFMVMRESILWRWSHTRHHSDTIIVGRDPEIAVPRPPDLKGMVMSFFNLKVYRKYFSQIALHSLGRMFAEEKTYIPEVEFPKVYRRARVYVAIYLIVIGLSIWSRSILPLLLVGLTNLFGTWLLVTYGYTQHAGLAENVLDHRLNCRTVYMCWIHRYLYWNMNYHVEHHMFPLVPYHALPRLHAAVKDDCPTPYPSLFSAWREIVPTVLRQVRDPGHHVKRQLPAARLRVRDAGHSSQGNADAEGWIEACAAADLGRADVVRFDHGKKTYALYRTEDGELYATDGLCTHGNVHLSLGLVKGKLIECSKHNGRFNLIDGSPARVPVCRGLVTYPIAERNGRIFINVSRAGGAGARAQKAYQFRVVSNRNVATFIKELVLEPLDGHRKDFFHAGRLPATGYSRLRHDSLSRFRHSRAVRNRVGASARIRPGGAKSRGRPAQQLLAGQQPAEGSRAALQRAHCDAASRAGLCSRGRLQLRIQPQARRHCFCHWPLRRFPYQAHATGDGLHWRGRRHGSATRTPIPPARNRAKYPQGQLLVWRAVKAGNLLRRLLSRSREGAP